MTRGSEPDGQVRYTVLSVRTIAAWAAGVVLVGVAVAAWLLVAYTGGDTEGNRVQLEAIRTAGTVVVGTGGAAALLLAARRQRSAEIALRQKDRDQADVARAYALQERLAEQDRAHQLRVAAATEADAEARRITDLYTKAVEQLGSDKAPVRLGGFYALERLAQENPGQRQTIVNVVTAYLRMPGATDGQEREVRLTAQRLLRNHLRPGQEATFWPDIDLDLTGATLVDFDLSDCTVRVADFVRASMHGTTRFDDTRFEDGTTFTGAGFEGAVTFANASFAYTVLFDDTRFADEATFRGTRFADGNFDRASFAGATDFAEAGFSGGTSFDATRFDTNVYFREALFEGVAVFQRTQFGGPSSFRGARFPDSCSFRNARFADYVSFGGTQFGVNVVFDKARFAADANFGDTAFSGGTSFHGAVFDRGVPSKLAKWASQMDS